MEDQRAMMELVFGGGANSTDHLMEQLGKMSSLLGIENPDPPAKDQPSVSELLKATKSDSTPANTRLEKILNMQADIAAYSKEGKDDEAYGLLSKQIKLGEQLSFAPVLINYYKTLIKTERADESEKIRAEITEIVRDVIKSSPKECELLGDKYRSNKDYFKAILFYQVGSALFTGKSDAEDIVNCLQGCILGIKLAITKLLKQRPSLQATVSNYMIPSMKMIKEQIHNIKGSSAKTMCRIEALCLHHIESVERLVDNADAREKTLKESIKLMEDQLGEEAAKYNLYGATLNNLGATYIGMQRPNDAIDVLGKALDAKMQAEDYDTEKEKVEDVEMSGRALSQAEEMLKSMSE